MTLVSSYQVNLGGNQDFQNLSESGTAKRQSKLNALSADESTLNRIQVIPFGYVPQMGDEKVAHVNIEGSGRAGTAVSLDLNLKVHDSSGNAGLTVDLIRFAATARRSSAGGFVEEAEGLLKSPPGTRPHWRTTPAERRGWHKIE